MREIAHVAGLDALYEFLRTKAPGRSAGGSGLHLDALGDQLAEHVGRVVIAGWGLLIALGDADAISEEEEVDRHLAGQQGRGIPERVIGFLAAIRRVLNYNG